jgi:hypothetical protein
MGCTVRHSSSQGSLWGYLKVNTSALDSDRSFPMDQLFHGQIVWSNSDQSGLVRLGVSVIWSEG